MNLTKQWHWADWVLFSIYTMWMSVGLFYVFLAPEILHNPPVLKTAIVNVLCYALPLLFWHPGSVKPGLFALTVLLTSVAAQCYMIYEIQEPISFVGISILIVGYLGQKRDLLWTFPVFVLLLPLTYPLLIRKLEFVNLFDLYAVHFLMFGIGFTLGRIMESYHRMKQLLKENEEQYLLIQNQNNILQQYSQEVERLTILEERDRLARELHDTVGHTFTSVIMGMDAVHYLMQADPQKASERLEKLREVTRNGLQEVREHIHHLAPDLEEGKLYQQLNRIAQAFASHTGTQIAVTQSGSTDVELSRQAKLTLIRCLQEALTNAKRHGQAASIDVGLVSSADKVALTVSDNGAGFDEVQYGFGIQSMRERIAALHGELKIYSRRGEGTVLMVTVPAQKG